MTTAQGDQLSRSGAQLHYWTSGPEAAPLVVFTHGATLDHRMFATQVEPLNSAGYRVLNWDMRGHGQSKPIGNAFNLKVAVDDLLAIFDHLRVDTATVIGHSFGGFVAQALTYHHAERVTALGVIGCTDLAQRPARKMALVAKLMPLLLPRLSLETLRRRTVEHVSVREDVKQYAYAATGQLNKDEYIVVTLSGVQCLAADSPYGPGYTIPRPFLLTHGEHDQANNGLYPKSAPAWAQREPNSVYKVVPQAGHTANQDNPVAFNKLLLDFLHEYAPT